MVLSNEFKVGMLRIKPLAPLSMVSSIPGSFYRSNQEPTLIMLYGMLENILGWHYSPEIRKTLKKVYIKNLKTRNLGYVVTISESGYEPVIQQYVRIKKLFFKPAVSAYTDLWTQHLKHNDKRHFDGVRNYDWRLTREINIVDKDVEKADLLKKYNDNFPNYYQSPKRREYIKVTGEYIYEIEIQLLFIDILLEKIENPYSAPYLGTSEGWVEIKIDMI